MQILLTISDELAAEAMARGLSLDRLLPELLAEEFAAPTATDEVAGRRNAAVDAMLAFAAKHKFTVGGDDLKSMVHEGHKS